MVVLGVGRVIVVVGALWLVLMVWGLVSVVVLVWGSDVIMAVEDVFEVLGVIGVLCGAMGFLVPELLVLLWGFRWVWGLVVEVFCPGVGVVVGDATVVQA